MYYDIVLLFVLLLVMVAFLLFFYQNEKAKSQVISDDLGTLEVDFILEMRIKKGWYGTFFDKVVKYGVITNLDDGIVLSKGDVVRVTVDGMKDGLWQAKVFTLPNLPRDAIVLTYKDDKDRWHCMYPGPQGVAMCGIVDHTPAMLVEKLAAGLVLAARCVENRHFELV